MNVSREEAIRMARELAEDYELIIITGYDNKTDNYIYTKVQFKILDEPVTAQLITASREPLKLYPFWHVQLYFDKMYYTADGIEVGIRADTGEVLYCKATGISGSPLGGDSTATPSSVTSTEPPPEADSTLPQTEPSDNSPTISPVESPPSQQPTSLSDQQPGFLGSTLPMEYGYVIMAAVAVAIAATTGYFFYKRRK